MYVNDSLLRRELQEPMVRRTKEEALETRSRILDAAERVFHEKGVAHAGLEDIASAAKVTRGAIYWHFRDKAELFDAMMQRVVLPAEEMLERAGAGSAEGPLELLRRATLEVLLRTARDPRMQRVFEIAYQKCEYVGDAVGDGGERAIARQDADGHELPGRGEAHGDLVEAKIDADDAARGFGESGSGNAGEEGEEAEESEDHALPPEGEVPGAAGGWGRGCNRGVDSSGPILGHVARQQPRL